MLGAPAFLDTPFDITDRGVTHIIKEQARRLKPLLEAGIKKKTVKAGGLPPIHLQTVCSGTDAPALAPGGDCRAGGPAEASGADGVRSGVAMHLEGW